MKVIYLAGPLSALTERERQANLKYAIDAAFKLRRLGFAVISPHEQGFCGPHALSYEGWMKHGLNLLKLCNAIYLLPGWEASPGTLRELRVAQILGIEVVEYDPRG